MPKPLKYREAIKRIRDHDKNFDVDSRKGKGGHRTIYHKIDKRLFSVIPFHSSKDLKKGTLKSIIRKLNLPGNIFD